MAILVKFMTATEVVTEYLVQGNFDEALVDKEIEPTQRRYIKKALGDDFYDELVTQVDLGTLTADNTELMDTWIKKVLSRYCVYEALPHIRNNITSQGVVINNTEFNEQSSRQDFGSLRSKVQSDADFEMTEMQKWLCHDDQSGKYPLYKKTSTKGKGGIYFY